MNNHTWIKHFIPLFLLALIMLAGCGGQAETATPEPAPTTVPPTAESADPTPASETAVFESPISPVATAVNSPLPTPSPTPQVGPPPTVTPPEPEAGQGVVYGRLTYPDGTSYVETTIRLGAITWQPGKEGDDGFVASDRLRSPSATTDEWGIFILEEVPPGDYGIAVDNPAVPGSTGYVPSDTGDKILVVSVAAGQTVDLQEIQIAFE
jgi:hypothetical protein